RIAVGGGCYNGPLVIPIPARQAAADHALRGSDEVVGLPTLRQRGLFPAGSRAGRPVLAPGGPCRNVPEVAKGSVTRRIGPHVKCKKSNEKKGQAQFACPSHSSLERRYPSGNPSRLGSARANRRS